MKNKVNREDFPMLLQDIVYFDNGATTLKPKCVIDKTVEYYEKYGANAHRGDYDISYKVDQEYENTRRLVKEYIHAKYLEEIIFTAGSTESLNLIVQGFFANLLDPNDEVLITKSEHASNVLPWFHLANKKGIKVSEISKIVTIKTKLYSFR